MTTREFLKETFQLDPSGHYVMVRPRVVCADGFSVSIQASSFTYSNPRLNVAEGFTEVELGFPSEPDDLIRDYAEDWSEPTNTVYGYVPVEIVDKLLEKHGGISYYQKPIN